MFFTTENPFFSPRIWQYCAFRSGSFCGLQVVLKVVSYTVGYDTGLVSQRINPWNLSWDIIETMSLATWKWDWKFIRNPARSIQNFCSTCQNRSEVPVELHPKTSRNKILIKSAKVFEIVVIYFVWLAEYTSIRHNKSP